jgi:hypothetical protein
MIHVVFNEIEVALMQEVMQQDESLQGEVSLVRDDFAVGPIADLDTEEGWNVRREWWMHKLELAGHNKEQFAQIDDRETVKELCRKLEENPEEQLWIWMGQNQHDVCGYYWLMPQLRAYQGRVMIMYMNNLPCINEKGQLFYPSWLHEIQPREFIKAKILVRPITLSEFEVDPDEWKRLCAENAMVRMLEGGKKISSQDETWYDAEILKNCTNEWQKATRVLTNTLHRMKVKTGDVFLMWRIKELIQVGKLATMGDTQKSWKDFDLKKAEAVTQDQASN